MKEKNFNAANRVMAFAAAVIILTSQAGCAASSDPQGAGAETEEGAEITEDASYLIDRLDQQQQDMIGPMQSWIYTDLAAAVDEEIVPSWTAGENVWEPIDNLINDWGETYVERHEDVQSDGRRTFLVSVDFLKECASALYADFDGTLPEIPSSLLSSGYGVSEKKNDDYSFRTNTWGEQYWDCRILSWVGHPDNSQTVEVGMYDGDFLLATYQFELVGNSYTVDQWNPMFGYSITGIAKTGEGEATDDEYMLPESDTRDYSEDELKKIDEWELDKARMEIYARHGRIFNTGYWFNNQVWYHGTIKPEDFNDDILNDHELANIKTILKMEDLLGDESITNSDERFQESWDIIQEYGFYTDDHLYDEGAAYNYSNLDFQLYIGSLEDADDYVSVRALFYKPVLVPANLKEGDKVTVCTNELEGTTEELTCVSVDGNEAVLSAGDDEYPDFSCENTGEDGMTEVYSYNSYGRLDCAFYEGIVRIRKDALTGAPIAQKEYDTASRAYLLENEYSFFDGVAFDENGYVTQLLYLGD